MRRMITRLSVLSALVLWSTASPVIRAQATTTTEHMTEPFDFEGADPCSGAPIVLTGDIETVLHITVDGHEGFHLNVHAQIHGTGQALTSDTSYVVNQSANFSVYADTCPAEETNEQDVEVVAEG